MKPRIASLVLIPLSLSLLAGCGEDYSNASYSVPRPVIESQSSDLYADYITVDGVKYLCIHTQGGLWCTERPNR